MPNGKPNILVIWGDDIGITNLSCYSDGLMGYRTPNIDRIAERGDAVHRLLRRAELHRRARGVHHRPERVPHRNEQGRVPGVDIGWAAEDPDDRRAAQAAGLRHRPVRQEPPRRPEQVPADRARIRRVLRQPLPPQRRGGARAARLPAQGSVPAAVRAGSARAASSNCKATDEVSSEPDDPKYGPVGKQTHRGHRAADQEADGDHRRRDRRRAPSTTSSASTPRASRSSCGATSPTCTSSPTPSRRAWARPGGGSRRTTTR